MNIPVLLEPTPTGFRASTGAPLNLVAEAPTADEALAAIRREFVLRQIAGVRVIELALPEPDPLIELTRRLSADPEILDEWIAATKAYRAEYEAREATADAAAERNRLGNETGSKPEQQEPAA